jgi:hypothetical protein
VAQRVLATQEAIATAQKLNQILSGSLTNDLSQLRQQGQILSDANQFDGPDAVKFRAEWQNESKALQQAITDLENLQKQAQQIVQNILKAGGA